MPPGREKLIPNKKTIHHKGLKSKRSSHTLLYTSVSLYCDVHALPIPSGHLAPSVDGCSPSRSGGCRRSCPSTPPRRRSRPLRRCRGRCNPLRTSPWHGEKAPPPLAPSHRPAAPSSMPLWPLSKLLGPGPRLTSSSKVLRPAVLVHESGSKALQSPQRPRGRRSPAVCLPLALTRAFGAAVGTARPGRRESHAGEPSSWSIQERAAASAGPSSFTFAAAAPSENSTVATEKSRTYKCRARTRACSSVEPRLPKQFAAG